MGGSDACATSAASTRSSARQPSRAPASRVSGRSTPSIRSIAHPMVIVADELRPSTRWENQSWVMNWIQKAARTLRNGAFL